MKLLERRSALPLCSKYLTPLRFGSVRKMGCGANILGNLGFKTWTTSVFMIEMMLMTMLLTVPDPPTHSKLEAAHCSLTFLANHPAQCSAQHSVAHTVPTVLPSVAQCCPPNTVNHPKTLFQVNHRQRFKITTLVSKLPLRDCLSTKSGSHNFFYVHQVSRQSDNSPRTRLTLKKPLRLSSTSLSRILLIPALT